MNHEVIVRSYCHEDEQAVIDLWQLAFPHEPQWNESKSLIDRKLKIQPELFFVATLEGRLVGTTIAGFDGVRGWIHKVATHPEFLRRGISRQLMSAAESGLKQLGCTKLNLQVRESNDGAVAFYESIGFIAEPRVNLGKHL